MTTKGDTGRILRIFRNDDLFFCHTGPRAGIFLTAWLPVNILLSEQNCSGDPGYFLRKFRDDDQGKYRTDTPQFPV